MRGEVEISRVINPFDVARRQHVTVPYTPGLTVGMLLEQLQAPGPVVIVRNGHIEEDLDRTVAPGDFIAVYPEVQEPISIALAFLVTAAELAIAQIAAISIPLIGVTVGQVVMGVGVLAVGGLVTRALQPSPATDAPDMGSPTYGFSGQYNPSQEGMPIPVVYGNCLSMPTVINHYLEIDSDGDQWAHSLLGVAEGLTNNPITADDVLANDEPLTLLEDYEFGATDGSTAPDTSVLSAKFSKLHHYRSLNKYLSSLMGGLYVRVLLHLNGSNGSTDIVEDSAYTDRNIWTCNGAAALSTAHPELGSANLDVSGAGDYVDLSEEESFQPLYSHASDEYFSWDIEFRFRQASLADSGICGQQRIDTAYEHYWGIFYNSGSLQFQAYKRVDSGGWSATTFFDISGAVSLSVDTWYHVRVACLRAPNSSTYTVKIWLDGSLVASGTQTNAPEVASSGTWSQQIGYAYRLEAGSAVQYDAVCELDEFRLAYQLMYDFDDFTVPTAEASIDAIQQYQTMGVVDELAVVFEAPLGMFQMDSNANLQVYYAMMTVQYRKVGDSAWTSHKAPMFGSTRYPVRMQYDYTMPERAQYEVRVYRATPDDEDSRKASRVYWIGLDEILDEFLTYPRVQCVSVSVKAQDRLSGSLPVYKVIHNRTEIEVPSFDGTSAQLVDPRKPGWAAFDMFTNELSGAGWDPTRIHESAWQDWLDWCAGLVDGNTRAQLNMVFDQELDFDRALQHVENVGRAKVVPKGTQVSVVLEAPDSPAFMFSAGNIVKDSFELTWIPQTERVDRIDLEYVDKDRNWARHTEIGTCSGYESLARVPRVARLFLPGINNQEQAKREVLLRMQIAESIKRIAEWRAGQDAIRCEAGNVGYWQTDGNNLTAGGRLLEDLDAVVRVALDKSVNLPSQTFESNCTLYVRTSDDTIEERAVLGPFDVDTTTIEVDSVLTAERFDPWMIARTTGEKSIYRLVRLVRSTKQTFALKAVQYDETAYYNAAYGGGLVAV